MSVKGRVGKRFIGSIIKQPIMKNSKTAAKSEKRLKMVKAVVIIGTLVFAILHMCLRWSDIGQNV